MIYMDCAASALQRPPAVGGAVLYALDHFGNPSRGAHSPSLDASRLVYGTREKLSRLLGFSSPERLSFTHNATEALNIAINGIFQNGRHCISTVCEHNSVLRPLYRCAKLYGAELTLIGADSEGNINYNDIEKAVRNDTKAIVITHSSNVTGNVTDIPRVSDIARRHSLLLVVDGAQTAGCFPVDIERDGIDIFCFSGHKGLMAPQGTGGIYIREGIDLPPLKTGGSGIQSFNEEHPSSMPEAYEAGTLNSHGIAGLDASLDFILGEGIQKIYGREKELSEHFYNEAKKIKGVKLYGNFGGERTAVVSLNIGDVYSSEVADMLWNDCSVCVRAGAHCAPLMHRTLGTEKQGVVRFSFSYYNTDGEIELALKALRSIAEE